MKNCEIRAMPQEVDKEIVVFIIDDTLASREEFNRKTRECLAQYPGMVYWIVTHLLHPDNLYVLRGGDNKTDQYEKDFTPPDNYSLSENPGD